MNIENMKIVKTGDFPFYNGIPPIDGDAIYCEITYQRDRASFAGVVFRFIDEENVVIVHEIEERMVKEKSKYEKLYVGCERVYINAMKETFAKSKKDYGIEVQFLVYSDVRSCQIIFEWLMESIDDNIDKIKQFCNQTI